MVFVPAKNFSESLEFYEAMGWDTNWRAEDDSFAELELGDHGFYLQNYYSEDWANNLMMHITVDDAPTFQRAFSGQPSRVDAPEGSPALGLSSWPLRPATPSKDTPSPGPWVPAPLGPWPHRTSAMVCRRA